MVGLSSLIKADTFSSSRLNCVFSLRSAEHSAITVGIVELTIEQLSITVDCSFLTLEVIAFGRT